MHVSWLNGGKDEFEAEPKSFTRLLSEQTGSSLRTAQKDMLVAKNIRPDHLIYSAGLGHALETSRNWLASQTQLPAIGA